MPDHTAAGLLQQIKTMRGRTEQLIVSAASNSAEGIILARLHMIHALFYGLERWIESGTTLPDKDRNTALTNEDIERIADTVARKLNVGSSLFDDDLLQKPPPKPS